MPPFSFAIFIIATLPRSNIYHFHMHIYFSFIIAYLLRHISIDDAFAIAAADDDVITPDYCRRFR